MDSRLRVKHGEARTTWVFVGFLAIAGFLLFTEHRAHVFGVLPILLLHVRDKLIEHRQYIERYGQDMPETLEWKWPAAPGRSA